MISWIVITEEINSAEALYPFPFYVHWYANKFPKKQLSMIGVFLIFIGIALVIVKAPPLALLITSAWLILILTLIGVTFLVNALMMYYTNCKRAKHLKIKYKEYIELINTI